MAANLERLILQRGGVLMRSELRAAGVSRRSLAAAIQAGTWRASGRLVLVHASAPPGLRTDTLIAAAMNPGAILTGTSAAVLRPHPVWSGSAFRNAPAMIIAPRNRTGPWATVRHPGAQYDSVHGLKVADVHTTLVDLLRLLPWRDAAAIAGAANQARLTSHELLVASVRNLRNHRGSPQLAKLVRAMLRGAESGPEVDLHLALFRHGLRGWVANPDIVIDGSLYRPDIAFLRQLVAVEYDGIEEHLPAAVFHHDRERDFAFEFVGGWLVARMTSRTLDASEALAHFMVNLRSALRRRSESR